MNRTPINGRCLCGTVQFEIEGPLTDCSYCLCTECRQLTGSALSAYGTIEHSQLHWIQGEDKLGAYRHGKATRHFCPTCSSCLLSTHDAEPTALFIALGCLEGAPDITIEYCQSAESQADWLKLDRTIRRFSHWPQ